jgi:hypothetical protein
MDHTGSVWGRQDPKPEEDEGLMILRLAQRRDQKPVEDSGVR